LKGDTSVTSSDFFEAKQALEELGFFGANVFGDYLPKWFATQFPEFSINIAAPTSRLVKESKSIDEYPEHRTRSGIEIDLTVRPSTSRVKFPPSPRQFPEASIAERVSRQDEEPKSPDETRQT
jgi:hypothetical protein